MLLIGLFRRLKKLFLSHERQRVDIRLGIFRGIGILTVPANSLQLRFGLYERETYKYVQRARAKATWFIDVGAGNGEMSILFSKAGCPVTAVEPWTPEMLRENIALNNAGGIMISERYLGTGKDEQPLDEIPVPRNGLGFIKIDADTAEFSILQSGCRLLAQTRPLLLVETHSARLERDCCALLADFGYRVEIIRNAWWRPIIPDLRPPHNRWFWAEPA